MNYSHQPPYGYGQVPWQPYASMPVYDYGPMYQQQPIYPGQLPAYCQTPAYNQQPVYYRVPMYNQKPAFNWRPAYAEIPVYNSGPTYGYQISPHNQETSPHTTSNYANSQPVQHPSWVTSGANGPTGVTVYPGATSGGYQGVPALPAPPTLSVGYVPVAPSPSSTLVPGYATSQPVAVGDAAAVVSKPPSRIEQPHIVGAPSGLPGSTASTLARPHYLIYQRNLVTVSQEPGVPCMPYIAVSYAWDASSSMSLVSMADRRVTRQAYEIMLDLSQRTNLALWIDAICIRQDDKQAKERELPRMADIYRGAAAVWCLVNSVDAEVCKSVQRYVDFADRELHLSSENGAARRKLESMFMASRGAKEGLTRLFAERWWQRAWTFQEATLNPRTLLVGAVPQHRDPWARDTPGGATVPIADVLKAARFPHWLTTGLTSSEDVLKRPQTFWDALLAQAAIAGRTVGLGEAMACVWRRDATIDHDLVYSLLGVCGLSDRVEPSYDKQFNTLLCEVFNAAAVAGDYSWVPWCSEIDHGGCPEGMSIVPTPQLVKSIPTTPVKAWTTAAGLPELPSDGPLAQCGVRVLMRNLGVVDACTAPLTLQETVEHLRQLGRSADDIWDMLFGTTVGLAADVTSVLADSAIMEQLLDYALSFIYAQQNVVNGKWEVSYKLAKTPRRLAYTEYGDMAQQSWFRRRLDRLVVVSCVSGEIVVRAQDAITMGADAALFALPVTPKTEGVARDLVIVSGEKKVIRACAMGVLVRNPGVSAGERWEATLVR